jgi:hypothetical protein
MARIVPAGWRELEASGAARREIETLALFAAALPDAYTVFHGVHWTRIERGFAIFGQIDFAIVAPSGRTLLIEQKSGFLEETAEGLVKKHARRERNVAVHLARSAEALRRRLEAAGEAVPIEVLLYCPDYTVRQPGSAGLDPSRIVDAGRRDALPAVVRALLPADEAPRAAAERVRLFFADELQLTPEIGALAGDAQALYTRLSGGLATWGRRIECEPFRLRVSGTAGSGKTQLGAAVFRDAVGAGRRPLYVCYNRPLADHMGLLMPAGGEVATYHQLCDRVLRALGRPPDFSRQDAFVRLEQAFAAADPGPDWRFDELIVDEGQDFEPGWLPALLRMLAPGGRAWWLEDPMQNLYGRAPADLGGWVTLHADTNYRSPRQILDLLDRLVPADRRIEHGSPVEGGEVEWLSYADGAGLIEASTRAITNSIRLGFPRQMIALVTFRGRAHSALAPLTRLGPHRLRVHTGRYDLLGSPEHSEGEIVLDSVYRFKGQSAPCVILTEIDFETLDELALRKLFVGMTRASMRLALVLSERSRELVKAKLGET